MAKKSTEELLGNRAGSASEASEKKPVYPAGVYELDRGDGTVSTIIAKDHALFGTVQSDALVRMGYSYVRPATAEELVEPDAFANMVADAKTSQGVQGRSSAGSDSPSKAQMDTMQARIDSLEKALASQVTAPATGDLSVPEGSTDGSGVPVGTEVK